MEKKIVKKTALEEKDLVKVVGGTNISSGIIGIDFLGLFKHVKKWY